MTRVEELQSVRATPAQAMATLLDPSRMEEWSAPGISIDVRSATHRLAPGDRFRVHAPAGPAIEYQVEAISEREVVLTFEGPWRGEERWSFVPDGEETIIRRTYTVHEGGGLVALAWRTLGQALVMASFKLELMRFRALVERLPRIRAEIESRTGSEAGSARLEDESSPAEEPVTRRSFTIDEG